MKDYINAKTLEDLICRAIKIKAYIEIVSLTHNVIELYLQYILEKHIVDSDGSSSSKLRKKLEILSNNRVYLINYLELCFLFNLIDSDMYEKIKKFNTNRNDAIHSILKSKPRSISFDKLKETARLGREIQLHLSPLKHSKEDIMQILYYFDYPDKMPEDRNFSASFVEY